MRTEQEIESDLRGLHPFLTDYDGNNVVAGDPEYERLIARWVAVEWEEQSSVEWQRAELRRQWELLPDFIKGPYRTEFETVNRLLDEGQYGAAAAVVEYAEVKAGFALDVVKTGVFHQAQTDFGDAIAGLAALAGAL